MGVDTQNHPRRSLQPRPPRRQRSIWWVVLWSALCCLFGFGLCLALVKVVPVVDQNNAVLAARDCQALDDLAGALDKSVDETPSMSADSPTGDIKRKWFGPVIINCTAPALHDQMGRPQFALVIPSSNPPGDADRFANEMRNMETATGERKYEVRVISDFDQSLPKGSMVMVTVGAFERGSVIFRRHPFNMGGTGPTVHTPLGSFKLPDG